MLRGYFSHSVLLTPSYQDKASTDQGCDSGNGCKWKIVKAIQVIELIGHGEKGEEEGAFKIIPDFLLEKMSS